MLNLERIVNCDRLMRAMTGLNRKAFEELLPSFTTAYQLRQLKPDRKRKRAPGGGRKATLQMMSDKLFYILLYCKCYPTFDLLSVLFAFDRSCAWDWVHGLLPILEQSLGHKQALPERKFGSICKSLNIAFGQRVTQVSIQVVYGTPEEVIETLGEHTAYVERTHLTSRQINGRRVRKTRFVFQAIGVVRSRDGAWEDWIYNLTRPLKTLRVEVNDGQRRWLPCSPAMAAFLECSSMEVLRNY